MASSKDQRIVCAVGIVNFKYLLVRPNINFNMTFWFWLNDTLFKILPTRQTFISVLQHPEFVSTFAKSEKSEF